MEQKRRSGRIVKELEIVLLGTDTAGKVFSEQTKTVVLSRHGAGVISRYRFTPDEVLTLRMPESDKEAEIRLVGQIGGEPGRYVYGVAFVDPNLDFWAMEFPAPNPFEPGDNLMLLECSLCQTQHNVEQGAIEEDVYSVNGYILFYCWECGASTPWKKADGVRPEAPARAVKPSLKMLAASPAPSSPQPPFVPPEPAFAESFESVHAASRVPSSIEQTSSYSDASEISEFASFSEVQTSAVTANATAVLSIPTPTSSSPAAPLARPGAKPEPARARELDAKGRRINKRRHVRIRVSFSACVRHPEHADQVVECENVSKGGVCFHSLEQYELGATIEVAAPYSPGETALFIPARIQRIEPLSGGLVFRYGIEYVNSFPSH